MNKLKIMLKSFILAAIAVFALNSYAPAKAALPEAENVNVIIDGEYLPGASVYKITPDTEFFSIKEVAEIYNAVLEWKPVSSEVVMQINNKKMSIKANSNYVYFGKIPKKMTMPSRLIKNDLYISPEILTSPEFAQITETETSWNKQALVLTVNRKSNITAIRYFTRPENTEIVVELSEPLAYTLSKGSASLVLTVHRGKVQRDFIYANNGMIRDILYDTNGKSADIKINLQQTPLLVKSAKLEKPDRISIDIIHSKKLDITNVGETVIDSREEPDKTASITEISSENQDAAPDSAAQPPVTAQYDNSLIAESVIETDQDNKDLKKVPVAKFENKNIVDDSYSIIDDSSSFRQIKKEMPAANDGSRRKRIIVIDAGHGGEDPGAVGPNGTKEKDINLAIAHKLKALLDKDENYETVLTRKDDIFIPLAERTNIANENHADLFISIHCNSNFNRDVSGFEVYFLSEKATDSEAAATATLENSVVELEGKPTKKRALLQEMLWSMTVNEYINDSSELCSFVASETPGRLKVHNRGVKQASFYVLRGAQMPAILVESAFLSNYSEESKLNTGKFQTAVSDSVYEGITKYYARKDKIGVLKK
ncbi:MAG: N-acetylmuramoyl-L-alanine amidase [Endomicrobium sp.]|jgi:N-acetylmuramoyl-L-alanine amidase|nr:N-acetylmuramoyl-L-alanine amidase [Endomicrobium sp.]